MASRLVRQPQQVARLRLVRDLGISPRRFHGWEPRTVQVGYDQEGNPCALADAWQVVAEVEPEWSDDDRAQLLALDVYEGGICECGVHISLTTDRSNVFTFEDRDCPVCRGVARYQRVQEDADEKATKSLGENPPPHTPRPGDGRHTYVRQMDPLEVEERRSKRAVGRA